MYRIIFLITFYFIDTCSSQTKVLYSFVSRDIYVANRLTLCDNDEFYLVSSVESGEEYFSRGKWKIKNGTLTLLCYKEKDCLPIYQLKQSGELKTFDSIVKLRFLNSLNKPVSQLIGLWPKDPKRSVDFQFSDSSGELVLNKNVYSTFFFVPDEQRFILDTANAKYPFYDLSKINHNLEFIFNYPEYSYDRRAIPFNCGKIKFTVKENGLYKENRIIYKKVS